MLPRLVHVLVLLIALGPRSLAAERHSYRSLPQCLTDLCRVNGLSCSINEFKPDRCNLKRPVKLIFKPGHFWNDLERIEDAFNLSIRLRGFFSTEDGGSEANFEYANRADRSTILYRDDEVRVLASVCSQHAGETAIILQALPRAQVQSARLSISDSQIDPLFSLSPVAGEVFFHGTRLSSDSRHAAVFELTTCPDWTTLQLDARRPTPVEPVGEIVQQVRFQGPTVKTCCGVPTVIILAKHDPEVECVNLIPRAAVFQLNDGGRAKSSSILVGSKTPNDAIIGLDCPHNLDPASIAAVQLELPARLISKSISFEIPATTQTSRSDIHRR